jgi:hypothetical protein
MVARAAQARKHKKRPKALSNNGNMLFLNCVTGLDTVATMNLWTTSLHNENAARTNVR